MPNAPSRKQRRRVFDDDEIEAGSSQPNGDGASTSRQPASGMKNASASSSGKRAGRKDRDDDVEDVDGGEDEEDEEDEGDAAVQQEIVSLASGSFDIMRARLAFSNWSFTCVTRRTSARHRE